MDSKQCYQISYSPHQAVFHPFLMCFSLVFVRLSYSFLRFPQVKACRCRGMSSVVCYTPRARCVPKMCCGLRCRRRGPTAAYKPSCKYFNYPLLELKSNSDLQAWKICLSLEEGRAGLKGIVIFPGHVVMAGLGAVIAREVRKEICGNNKPSENTSRAS